MSKSILSSGELPLFYHSGSPITIQDFRLALKKIVPPDCEILYIHTALNFGTPNPELQKSTILEITADLLYELHIPTIIMPSYTFSYCNNSVFDPTITKSPMGVLNEFLRTKHRWTRSFDPLMSNILHGRDTCLITDIGFASVGLNSTFDLIAKIDAPVQFLFFGPRLHECFTFMHYLEWVLSVPYRYDFKFSGYSVMDGHLIPQSYSLFIRDSGVEAGDGASIFENMLVEQSLACRMSLGAGTLTSVSLSLARDLYLSLLNSSPSFFIRDIFTIPTRSNNFKPRKMVAL